MRGTCELEEYHGRSLLVGVECTRSVFCSYVDLLRKLESMSHKMTITFLTAFVTKGIMKFKPIAHHKAFTMNSRLCRNLPILLFTTIYSVTWRRSTSEYKYIPYIRATRRPVFNATVRFLRDVSVFPIRKKTGRQIVRFSTVLIL